MISVVLAQFTETRNWKITLIFTIDKTLEGAFCSGCIFIMDVPFSDRFSKFFLNDAQTNSCCFCHSLTHRVVDWLIDGQSKHSIGRLSCKPIFPRPHLISLCHFCRAASHPCSYDFLGYFSLTKPSCVPWLR